MHTATQLSRSKFSIDADGAPADLEALFPSWTRQDRFGVVVDGPCGAVGASLLIQAAITLFYETRPRPRTRIYPEVYAFHVGRPHGDHSPFDFYPARKQVVVESDARSVLAAINDRAITRLAVVDGAPAPVEIEWQELGPARDRISSVFAYSPAGRVTDPDIVITGTSPDMEDNASMTLHSDSWPATVLAMSNEEMIDFEPRLAETDAAYKVLRYCTVLANRVEGMPAIARGWAREVAARTEEVSPETRRELIEQRQAILENGLPTESYRRISVDDGLGLLARQA